jgi:ethanolamine ammonia-lyase small subunit
MDRTQIDAIVQAVLKELKSGGTTSASAAPALAPAAAASAPPAAPARMKGAVDISIDLPDLTTPEMRKKAYIENPANPEALRALMATTPARIGVGRAGPRYKNESQFLFLADHAVTQDALFKEIDPGRLQKFNLFQVQTRVKDRQEYLLRPDLGRMLSDEARKILEEKCVKNPDVQLYVADGLSVAAIEANLGDIFPILQQGLAQAGLKMGTPFYVKYGRVGLMNDINKIVNAQVLAVLIGERPGLGRAESMSVYMGFRPQPDSTDADRDVVCNIYAQGTNPLEAGAFVVEYIKRMIKHQASGVKLKMIETGQGK